MKLKKIVSNIFFTLFSLIILLIMINSIYRNHVIKYDFNIITILVGVIIYIVVVCLIYNFLKNHNIGRRYTKTAVVIIILMFSIQIVFGYLFRVEPSWDFGAVVDGAKKVAEGTNSLGQIDYLYVYTNNVGLTMILSLIYKFCSLFNITNFNVIGIITNIIFIDLSVAFTYLTCEKLFEKNKALIVLIVMATLTPLYTYVPIYYTDTLSLFFMILPIYLYVLSDGCKERQKRIIVNVLMILTIFVGIVIKFTVIIPLISIIICKIIFEGIRNNMEYFLTILLSIAVLFIAQNLWMSNIFNREELLKKQFPYTHWIMMGLKGDGGYDGDDTQATRSKESIKEKQNYNISQIKLRISEYYENGKLIDFYYNKLLFTWGDGTFFAPEKLRRFPIDEGAHDEYILYSGEHKEPYLYFSQIQYVSILILIIFSCYSKRNVEDQIKFILTLSVFGLMLFLLIWEARSRYVVNYIPYFCIIAVYGIDNINNIYSNLKCKLNKNNIK